MKNNKPIMRAARVATLGLALGLVSGFTHAALQGRDLDGNANTAEAYYDTELNITWLADANYGATANYQGSDYGSLGYFTWDEANAWADSLSFTASGNTYDNWRLPSTGPADGNAYKTEFKYDGSTDFGYNVSAPGTANAGSHGSEMAHLFYNTLAIPAICSKSSGFTCDYQSGGIYGDGVTTDPFVNFQPYGYWSGTQNPNETHKAFSFGFQDGFQDMEMTKANYFYAMAVSNGDVGVPIGAPIPEADTWAMLLAGLGLVGVLTRRRS